MNSKIAFLMPEFPGHTHTWLWREICGLRDNGLVVHLASTRPPKPEDRARHAFAADVDGQVFYVWPPRLIDFPSLFAWCLIHPRRAWRCSQYAIKLQRDGGKHYLKNMTLVLPGWRLGRWCKQNDLRHVHVATPANSLIVAHMAAILFDLSTDVTINSHLDGWGGALREKLDRCRAIFVVAQWMSDQVSERFPGSISDRTHLARHGVNTKTWTFERQSEKTRANTYIVSVGRLHPAKGHDDAIKAVRILLDHGFDVKLDIAGSGTHDMSLRKLIENLELESAVSLLGPLSEEHIKVLMGEADIFVAASHNEPLGVVYMEAMAVGTCVVGTNRPLNNRARTRIP